MNSPLPVGSHSVSVLADDLTGATDTVVQFRSAGWESYLLLTTPSAGFAVGSGPLAFSRSLDSRALSNKRAAEITAATVADTDRSDTRLYIKIDSTMRGSVDGQISGALSSWESAHAGAIAVICPAYPAMGRTVRDGHLYVHGSPVNESAAAHDPVTPVTTSDITAMIPGAVSLPSTYSPQELATAIVTAVPAGGRIVVDAETRNDLDVVARAIQHLGARAIAVGSAGFAQSLAKIWYEGEAPPAARDFPNLSDGQLIVLITSLNETSLIQAEHLARAYRSDLVRHQYDPRDLSDAALVEEAAAMLQKENSRIVLLQPSPPSSKTEDALGSARSVARGLARIIAHQVASRRAAGLILVGGDGAEATLAQLDATALNISGAVSEGVPLGVIVGGFGEGLPVVTKAGGFGEETTLTTVATRMLNLKEN